MNKKKLQSNFIITRKFLPIEDCYVIRKIIIYLIYAKLFRLQAMQRFVIWNN
jgi:hypothetical protein